MTITRRSALGALCAAGLATAFAPARAQVPPGYSRGYRNVIAAAAREGALVVWGATDARAASPLVQDFQALYPAIRLDYHDLQSNQVYERMFGENSVAAGVDVAWSSAMDLQIKLVNDGFAQRYDSPEAPQLPPWAAWRNEAFGTTVEPVVLVYNKRLLAPARVPRSHAALLRLLQDADGPLRGRVVTYDPESSGLGFLLMTQDAHVSAQGLWGLVRALGEAGVRTLASSAAMIGQVAAGASVLGYNVLGSYAAVEAKRNADLGIVLFEDYTLIISRIMFIARKAPHPNAARLWLNYVLSRRGQQTIAGKADMYSIRGDVAGDTTAAALKGRLGHAFRPVSVGPGLLTYLDQSKRHEFLRRWREALSGQP